MCAMCCIRYFKKKCRSVLIYRTLWNRITLSKVCLQYRWCWIFESSFKKIYPSLSPCPPVLSIIILLLQIHLPALPSWCLPPGGPSVRLHLRTPTLSSAVNRSSQEYGGGCKDEIQALLSPSRGRSVPQLEGTAASRFLFWRVLLSPPLLTYSVNGDGALYICCTVHIFRNTFFSKLPLNYSI